MGHWRHCALFLLVGLLAVKASYIPSLRPTNFCRSTPAPYTMRDKSTDCQSEVFVHVNKLDSVEKLIPYDYSSFDFCQVKEMEKEGKIVNDIDPVENLGQILLGEKLRASGYNISFAKNESMPKLLCTKKYAKDKESVEKLNFLRERIHESYMHQWVVDNMPVTWCYSVMESKQPYCTIHFPLGCYVSKNGVRHDACYLSDSLSETGATYVFNHNHIQFFYHRPTTSTTHDGRIVRAIVRIASCGNPACDKPLKLPTTEELKTFTEEKPFVLNYTYTVEFIESDAIRWASRWDYILSSHSQDNVQLFSVINSVLITIFLSATVITIIAFTLRNDLALCQSNENLSDDVQEFYGWKELHGDVFRPPAAIMMLSVLTGTGLQLLVVVCVALVFACIGFLSPPNRGALVSAVVVLYTVLGCVSGYFSAILYKMMGGIRWKTNTLMTLLFVPGLVFAMFFLHHVLLWSVHWSAGIPFTTLLILLALFFGIYTPLTILGSVLGFKQTAIEQPVATNVIPREIPKQRWFAHPILSSLVGGILPFACIFIQLFFILNSIWSGGFYYQYGFVWVAYIILIIVCAQTSISSCYFQLRSEDYRWWWRSFFSTGTTSLYVLFFAIHFFVKKTTVTGLTSGVIYFGYTFLMVFFFFIITGSVGFLSSFVFVRKLYSILRTNE